MGKTHRRRDRQRVCKVCGKPIGKNGHRKSMHIGCANIFYQSKLKGKAE